MRLLALFGRQGKLTMRGSSRHCQNFLWRQRWFIVLLSIFTTTLIVTTQYYNDLVLVGSSAVEPIEVLYSSHVYKEVLRRWYNFSVPQKWYNNEKIFMFDEDLLREIRDEWIIKNEKLNDSYVLREPELRDPSMGQARAIMEILKNKRNGFFIECGAYDGETRSNTLVLERFFGWSGILIEADPINFAMMLRRNRKSYMSPTCLSIKPHPMNVSFLMARNIGRIHEPNKDEERDSTNPMDVAYDGQHVKVQCFPLASYVAALGVKTVDYFSLDVEGSEMEVLETIPFDQVDIKALSVEYIHGTKSLDYMINFMAERGYYIHSFVTHPDNLANDVIFGKNES